MRGAKSVRLILAACICSIGLAHGQQIRIYSEFERFDPFGNPVPADRDMAPREILSPTIARNGHLSVHVVITAPPGTNYFLYAASNPADILTLTLYREYFVRCGVGYCPDWLNEIKSPSFGAIPESLSELHGQSTRCYLLDIRARPDTPPRRVRVEALLKVGTWLVAPMEVRIMAPTVPAGSYMPAEENLEPLEAASSATSHLQLFRYLTGLQPQLPSRIVRLRDISQRNAAEDMLLARDLDSRSGLRIFPELNLLSWSPVLWPSAGAEWYLRVRDFLHNFQL